MSRPVIPLSTRPGEPVPICQWFALCERIAVVVIAHPILEWVPACRECSQRVRAADQGTL